MALKILIELSDEPGTLEDFRVYLIDTKECRTVRQSEPVRFETAVGIMALWVANGDVTR